MSAIFSVRHMQKKFIVHNLVRSSLSSRMRPYLSAGFMLIAAFSLIPYGRASDEIMVSPISWYVSASETWYPGYRPPYSTSLEACTAYLAAAKASIGYNYIEFVDIRIEQGRFSAQSCLYTLNYYYIYPSGKKIITSSEPNREYTTYAKACPPEAKGPYLKGSYPNEYQYCTKVALSIVLPRDKSQIAFSQQNYNSTPLVEFSADPGAGGGSASIAWVTKLEYQTSKGKGARATNENFLTTGAGIRSTTFNRVGGKLTVQASATINGTTLSATPHAIYVVGTQIPKETITGQLLPPYVTGATPRLLTGIAMRESTYRQFCKHTLYGVSALWPCESGEDGGSHIGLMQVPVIDTPLNAWDWLTNINNGVKLFKEKLSIARNLERMLIARHPGLRQLTALERERMAVVLYGPKASKYLTGQYFIPRQTENGSWEWKENIEGNLKGVDYAKSVYEMMQ